MEVVMTALNKELKKYCFVISPIGENESDVRKRSDEVFSNIICQSVDENDYVIERADLINRSGIAMRTIFEKIENSNLVIADITGGNPNVFYELSVRHATGKPCILIASEGYQPPFDINGIRIIYYNFSDGKSLLASIKNLKNAVQEQSFSTDNPLTIYMSSKMPPAGATIDQGRSSASSEFFRRMSILHDQQTKRFDGFFFSYKYSYYTHHSNDYQKPFLMTPIRFISQKDYITLDEKSFDDDPWKGFGVVTESGLLCMMHCESRTSDAQTIVISRSESKNPKILYGAELYVGRTNGRNAIFSRPILYIRVTEEEYRVADGHPLDFGDLPDAARRYLTNEDKSHNKIGYIDENTGSETLLLNAETPLSY
jgi:hypothetical protein